ncbi:hypothetical protein Pint_28258 [Pistacia integerrima]|uniref:Uncharacterized protein n=1 Tax=Pistacia integerrima TaxID=434235 RepID=A0ACC0YSB8_9ROSI|nr:hypothetical protein Pint_28258 [Pistacia integerrima]
MRYRVSYLMDEIWERAVETALDGQKDHKAARTLTLDGAVKCVQGRLPPPSLLERFDNLELLSIANIGVSSLEQFPRLKNLEKLVLSDNRIAGGLEFLVQAGLDSLRDLDLSNNRIQFIEDLAPLAQLKLISLDLYECPVTRVKDYRSRVFAMIKSLKYLDKMDAEENERPESDDEEDDDDEDDEDDPGSGEVDGEDRLFRRDNGHSENIEGIVDAEEDEESDADEEETETARQPNETSHQTNGHENVNGEFVDFEDEGYDYDEIESGEEIFEEEDVAAVGESDDEEDGVEDDDEDDNDNDDDDNDNDNDNDNDDEDEEEEVDNDEIDGYFADPESTGRLTSTEGEIDGHEQGEEDGDDDGETGEEEQAVEDDGEFEIEDEEEEEDCGAGYLVQPVEQAEEDDGGGSDMEAGNEEEVEEEEVQDDEEVQDLPAAPSQLKRKRGDDVDEDDSGEDDEDVVESSSKKHH